MEIPPPLCASLYPRPDPTATLNEGPKPTRGSSGNRKAPGAPTVRHPDAGNSPPRGRRVTRTRDQLARDTRLCKLGSLKGGRDEEGSHAGRAAPELPLLPGLGKRFRGARHAAAFGAYGELPKATGNLTQRGNSETVAYDDAGLDDIRAPLKSRSQASVLEHVHIRSPPTREGDS